MDSIIFKNLKKKFCPTKFSKLFNMYVFRCGNSPYIWHLTKGLIDWAVKRNVSKRGNYLNYLISWTLFDIFALIIISIFANTSPIPTNPLSIITLIRIEVDFVINQLEIGGEGHMVTWLYFKMSKITLEPHKSAYPNNQETYSESDFVPKSDWMMLVKNFPFTWDPLEDCWNYWNELGASDLPQTWFLRNPKKSNFRTLLAPYFQHENWPKKRNFEIYRHSNFSKCNFNEIPNFRVLILPEKNENFEKDF